VSIKLKVKRVHKVDKKLDRLYRPSCPKVVDDKRTAKNCYHKKGH